MDRIHLPSLLLGYHGCDQTVADGVVSGHQELLPSVNPYDWLGNGIYFWESDSRRASEWAAEMSAGGKIKRPAVLGAIIAPGNCLNLLDRVDLQGVRDAYQYLVRLSEDGRVALPDNRSVKNRPGAMLRYLDCAVVNLALTLQIERGLPRFDTVRAAFLEGDPVYPGAGFNDRNHIQICVVNPRAIRGYFHPRP